MDEITFDNKITRQKIAFFFFSFFLNLEHFSNESKLMTRFK